MGYEVLRAHEAEAYARSEDWGRINSLAGVAVGNALGVTLGRVLIKPGCNDPMHAHDNCEEVIYVVSGVLGYHIGAETVILHEGDTLVVPAGVFHNGKNLGGAPAEIIVAYSAGKIEVKPA